MVRAGDVEPYTALRWVGMLFKAAAVFLIVAVIAEFIAGLRAEGWDAIPVLLGEVAQTAVLAVVLWGGGDLVRLLIDIGHDIRADRILLTRLTHRTESGGGAEAPEAAARHWAVRPREAPREAGPEAAD